MKKLLSLLVLAGIISGGITWYLLKDTEQPIVGADLRVSTVPQGGTGWANLLSNTVLLGNGTSRIATTTAGSDGQVLMLSGGVPTWAATSTGSGDPFPFTWASWGVSTSTAVGFTNGLIAGPSASSTFSGLLNATAGLTVTGTVTLPNGEIGNAELANSTISGVSLGGTLFALTNGATLNGSSYDGSSAISDWDINLANTNAWTTVSTTTWAGGLSVASIGGLTSASGLTITGGAIILNADTITDFTGVGLQMSGTSLTLNATGDWTGTLDTLEASAFLLSGASDSYTSGTLTFDSGTALTMSVGSTFTSSIVGTSTWAGGLSVSAIGGITSASGVTITGGRLLITSTATSSLSGGLEIESGALYSYKYGGFTRASTTRDNNYAQFNTATTTWNLANLDMPMTLVSLYCITRDAGTVKTRIGDGTNWASDATNDTINCTTTGVEKVFTSNNIFTSRENIQVQIGTSATSPDEVTITTKWKPN